MPDLNYDISGEEYFRYVEESLVAKLGLDGLSVGGHVLRNEKGWRENEKQVDYIWMVYISRFFVGKGCIFSLKFAETQFREHFNKAGFAEGMFFSAPDGKAHLYTDFSDETAFDIQYFNKLDLFDANKGITLDGVSYHIRIIAPNIDTFIHVGNPNSKDWKEWESGVWKMGRSFGEQAGHPGMIGLFS
jgi:hypothetical protein